MNSAKSMLKDEIIKHKLKLKSSRYEFLPVTNNDAATSFYSWRTMTQLRVATITDLTFQIQQSAKAKENEVEKRAHPSPRLTLQIAHEETETKVEVAK